MSGGHTIRPLVGPEELKACVALQEETWGAGFSERVPPALLKVAQMLGGVAAGAWSSDGTLDGFVFGMTGVRDGEVVHWSDMLAVRRGIRDKGLGTSLKGYQRQVLLERGVRTTFWTFDPLQARNAHINFTKLGIVVREYVRDMYGETDSPLHRGIGTDRFVALWLMDSERVTARMAGVERGPGAEGARNVAVALGALGEADTPSVGEEGADGTPPAGSPGAGPPPAPGIPRPGTPVLGLDAPALRVAIPADISRVMATSMELAVEWREATRSVFTHYLGRGYEVKELVRGGRTSDYLLEKRASP
jgi:predicted GNAT superfamily acetyltransferase